jgi:tetratricopeptide (TPR) repeat protein
MSCQFKKTSLDYAAKYVRGDFSEAEQETFEAHYLGCEECFNAVRFAEKVSVTMHHYGASIFAPAPAKPVAAKPDWLVKLKYELEDLYVAFSREWRTAVPALAAYVLLTVALGFGYYKLTSSSQLAQESVFHVEQPSAMLPINHTGLAQLQPLAWSIPEETAANKPLSDRLAAAKVLYQHYNYFLAVEELATIANDFPESIEAHLYLGISQLLVNQPAEGIKSLRRVLELDPKHAEAQWYIAQAYIVQGDSASAQSWLAQLAEQHDPVYGEGAYTLLKKIAKTAQQKK